MIDQKKNLKHYIHFLIGCDVQITTSSATFTGKLIGYYYDIWNYQSRQFEPTVQVRIGNTSHYYKLDNIKPILRPISDMTKEEGKEWLAVKEKCWDNFNLPMQGLGEMANWLLSKNFDLFDLINSGIAIAKEVPGAD